LHWLEQVQKCTPLALRHPHPHEGKRDGLRGGRSKERQKKSEREEKNEEGILLTKAVLS
jgi:hypothetical protein